VIYFYTLDAKITWLKQMSTRLTLCIDQFLYTKWSLQCCHHKCYPMILFLFNCRNNKIFDEESPEKLVGFRAVVGHNIRNNNPIESVHAGVYNTLSYWSTENAIHDNPRRTLNSPQSNTLRIYTVSIGNWYHVDLLSIFTKQSYLCCIVCKIWIIVL
jgi:hypothetical protein